MSRDGALARAREQVDGGAFLETLARRVAIPSTSQDPEFAPALAAYLRDEMTPALEALGCAVTIHDNPAGAGPFLIGARHEADGLPTVLTYGHGDVVRGLDDLWRDGLSPWRQTIVGERVYGRGTADNKGQHSVVLAGLAAVLAERGKLGCNLKVLIETGEEVGSPGLRAFAQEQRAALAADVLIASDGPRLRAERPTLFMGARGAVNFELVLNARDGAHHSGNWGGLLSNPAIRLAHALSSLTDAHGTLRVPAWRPPPIPDSVRAALAEVTIDQDGEPRPDPNWGEPGLTMAERVYAWNSFEVLAFTAGTPGRPTNAIPPAAKAWCQLRFVADTDVAAILPGLRAHLDAHGFDDVVVEQARKDNFPATRMLPDHPWVRWAVASMTATLGQPPVVLPNLGGSLPNDVFAELLAMPTLWVPHSYPACEQHGPNEHALLPILREGVQLMAGLFWDLGEAPPERPR